MNKLLLSGLVVLLVAIAVANGQVETLKTVILSIGSDISIKSLKT
jgi:hypothetical protein